MKVIYSELLLKLDCPSFIDHDRSIWRFYMKEEGVMSAIRPKDDMVLVSSTIARVFVNRWLLMTGCRPSSLNPPRIHPSSTHPFVFPFLPSFHVPILISYSC